MPAYKPLFLDRADAGAQLAERLKVMDLHDPVVYALPRGGAPVAAQIASALSAPLDIVLVRKIGAPGNAEVALAAVVGGADDQMVVNEQVAEMSGASKAYLEAARQRELQEIERRRRLYLAGREPISPAGRTAIVVDDGLATGATAKIALRVLKRQGAAKTVLATPVAPQEALGEMRAEADEIVCLHAAEHFLGVGAYYGDFHQLSDKETLAFLAEAGVSGPATSTSAPKRREVRLPPLDLIGDLQLPAQARGLILFAHGSGSSRASPRNRAVAADLNDRGFGTLLFDLLSDREASDRRNVFDITLLAERLASAASWAAEQPELANLPIGFFGASTGAGAALKAAARLGAKAQAVVSRGGRPDLAGGALSQVSAPTLLIVGGADHGVIELNRAALGQLVCDKAMKIVPGATHLFEEPGTIEQVMALAGDWFETKLGRTEPAVSRPAESRALATTPKARLAMAVEPLPEIGDPGFAAAFDRYADARVVLLGEASHGTSEFYRARAAITRRLIEKHGFNVVAVEADWPDAAAIDRYVRHKSHQMLAGGTFSRFPTWMWRNTDVEGFTRWLRAYNFEQAADRRAMFCGLDLYNMRGSMAAVLEYLEKVDPSAAAKARERYACLEPWSEEPAAYGRAALNEGYAPCEPAVVSILVDLLRKSLVYAAQDGETFFDATQNARLVMDAERYYRAMYYGGRESWNLRDRHMFETLDQLLSARGKAAKAVVWAHNSHIGDARYTDMGAAHGELNIGQLCRERFGRDAALIGFGTHGGTVLAASDWDGPAEVKAVRPSLAGSYEALCHQTGEPRFLLDLRPGRNEACRTDLLQPRLERYIGVIYRPDTERMSHYSRAILPEQYDGFVWFDQTRAVTPLRAEVRSEEEETYPFGV